MGNSLTNSGGLLTSVECRRRRDSLGLYKLLLRIRDVPKLRQSIDNDGLFNRVSKHRILLLLIHKEY